MKAITSAGGPYIIVDRHGMQDWGANVRKSFSPALSPFPDDYEAIGDLTEGRAHPPCNIAKFVGQHAEALLITLPFEIAIIKKSGSCIYLAQAEYAEPDWSFSDISYDLFDAATFKEVVPFTSAGSIYRIFDSAYLHAEIEDDFLEFELAEGNYVFAAATHKPDQRTGLLLYRIDQQ